MAGWFGSSKVDHPLADPKSSRKTISELPQDTFKALGEVAYWLDSLHATDGFRVDRRLEVIEEFDQALAELPPEQRELFIKQEIEGHSFREIAEESGIPINTLLSRKRYAILGLRARLQDLYDEFFG